ncbi:unnamed protein product [Mytilus edulis]|uniref:WSC domain-containing protein n=1 Tax=Mytilus edulis TaxID=6550 RepID=A0A8S3U875_MYTED|nr:unnamed protein product [Mytilus edulis]
MPYERLNGGGSMTNDICVTHCCLTLDSATYSGTEASYVCFCSNVASTDNFVRRDPAGIKCDYPCDGNTTEMCGGSWSLSVYKIETDNSPSTETTTNIPTIIEISKLPPELTTEATIEGNSPSTERTLTTYTRTTNDISTRTLKVSTESTERGKSSSTETTTNAPTAIDISTSTTKQSNSPSATYIQELPVDATEGSNNCMCPCGNVFVL